jgi:hypothetical protein
MDEVNKMEPIIKTKTVKIYPKIVLEPIPNSCHNWDKLYIEFREDGIHIVAQIDGAGNEFILPYESIRGVIR